MSYRPKPSAAQHARLQDTRRIRRTGQDQEGSLSESSALSVKAGQPHPNARGSCATAFAAPEQSETDLRPLVGRLPGSGDDAD
jgi:hypothetical protein